MQAIKVIKLGGEDRVINLNLHAMFCLTKQLNCELDDIVSKLSEAAIENPLRGIAFIIYSGIIGQKEIDCDFTHGITLKDVMGWIGDGSEDDFLGIWDLFKQVNEMPSANEEQIANYAEQLKKKDSQLI